MEEKDLDFFKDLLMRWLDELLQHADDTVEGLLETDNYLPDPLDRASFESNRSTSLRIRDRESMLIHKIKNSLEDIKNGEYGICENCGREIAFERLKARPVARRCIRCKTKQENLEKIIGL
ncbi:MAG: RNA polymerase-binding protein DksA [Desulfobacterales bacterium]|jgi:DnaK suppressor protein